MQAHIARNSHHTGPFLIWINPAAPVIDTRAPIKHPMLALVRNDDYSKTEISRAQKLANWLRLEFTRLTCDGTISFGASVTLTDIPSDSELETACAIVRGDGYKVEAQRHEPYFEDDEPVVTVWLEKATRS